MNTVCLIGRITNDLEMEYFETKKGEIASLRFSVAIDRNEDVTDFIQCDALGATAEFIEKWFKKGTRIGLVGRIQQDKWQTKDGENRYRTYVMINHVDFADGKAAEEEPKKGTRRGR